METSPEPSRVVEEAVVPAVEVHIEEATPIVANALAPMEVDDERAVSVAPGAYLEMEVVQAVRSTRGGVR